MRLLDKKTVNTVMAGQRKSQIDEGVTIARKIDALRQDLSSLEKQRDDFLSSSTTALKDKTEKLNDEIFYKEKIVRELEEQRKKLLEPLTIKWDEVAEEEDRLIAYKEELVSQEKILYSKEVEIEEKYRELSLEEERMEDLKQQINIQVDKVQNSSIQAQNILVSALDREVEIEAKLEAKKKKIDDKEQEVLIRERNIVLRENIIKQNEDEIIKTKLQLADQRATLDRAFARLK